MSHSTVGDPEKNEGVEKQRVIVDYAKEDITLLLRVLFTFSAVLTVVLCMLFFRDSYATFDRICGQIVADLYTLIFWVAPLFTLVMLFNGLYKNRENVDVFYVVMALLLWFWTTYGFVVAFGFVLLNF